MKEIRMDYDKYQQELRSEREQGRFSALFDVARVAEKVETLDYAIELTDDPESWKRITKGLGRLNEFEDYNKALEENLEEENK